MGRRKERRLAAISATGRRVKLDLFAEPSEDVGDSSPQEENGGNGDSKSHAKLPTSPSSSGKQRENPLLLLGQYSDDELDEGLSEGHNQAVAKNASVDIDEEEKNAAGKESKDSEINHDKEPTELLLMDNSSDSQDSSKKLEKESNSITEIDSDDLRKQTQRTEDTTSPAAPDERLVGEASSCWKMVLHEESNQYYYWNIATGDTSWEVPDILAQANVTTSAEKVIEDTEGKMNAVIGTYKSYTPTDMEEGEMDTRELSVYSNVNFQTSENAYQGTKTGGSDRGIKDESTEDEEVNRDGRLSVERNSETDLPTQLIKHCESLLERLNSVKDLNCYQEGQDLKLKFTLEIETRLADIQALASHGSSMLPFWLHSESQIERLEAAVKGVIQSNYSASLGGNEPTLESCEGIGDVTEICASENKAQLTSAESDSELTIRMSNYDTNNDSAVTTEHEPSMWYSSNYPANEVCGKAAITETDKESELTPRPALHSVEDVDMDVDMDMDMEVDDTPSVKSPHGGASGAHDRSSTELSIANDMLADHASTVPGEVLCVAPPGEEWIPPPPPDNEIIPPPPPDDEPFPPPPPYEPPGTSYAQISHIGSVQSFPYPEQYSLPYSVSSLEYYGQTNLEVSGIAPYTHSEGAQVAVSPLPHYYEAVPNLYAVAHVIVNPVQPTAYYGLHNGALPVSLISGVPEPSGTQSEPVTEILDSGTAGSLNYLPEAGSNLLPETNLSVIKSGDATVNAPLKAPEAHMSTGASATFSLTNGVSGSSTSDTNASVSAAAAAATTTYKSQSKVPRTKKRTVAVSTLRSNKKVSSLVDKWKAAKEELHEEEEEEEPEDANEILERKRQREIEEWRAQQIASGEAKANANFQPLGGDWRARVKRKRAQKMKESEKSSPDVTTDGNQQPDLVQLSKGLPSSWQVYWDDSSKQVYYGNVRTSETIWTRPTD